MATKVRHIFHEDHEETIDFFFNGKDDVIGLRHPDASLLNTSNHYYIRIGLIEYEESLLSTDEITIDEELLIAEEVESSTSANSGVVNSVHIHGIVKGKRAVKNTFRCICNPLLSDSGSMNIAVTEDSITVDGVSSYCLGIWLETKDFYKIFVTSTNSISRYSMPIDGEFLDSKYYLTLLQNSEIETNVNTTNVYSQISTRRVCNGVNIYTGIHDRLTVLENTAMPRFQACYVSYDEGFTPQYSNSVGYQVIAPSAFQYTFMNTTNFTTFNSDRQSISVLEAGTYILQLSSNLVSDATADIEVCVYLDDTKLPTTVIKKCLSKSADESFTSNQIVLDLTTSSKIRVKFKFGNRVSTSITNNGTYLSVLRIL